MERAKYTDELEAAAQKLTDAIWEIHKHLPLMAPDNQMFCFNRNQLNPILAARGEVDNILEKIRKSQEAQ